LAPRLWPLNSSRPKQNVHALAPSESIARLLDEADHTELELLHESRHEGFDVVMREILDENETDLLETETAVIRPIPPTSRRPEPLRLPTRPAPKLATNPGDLVFVFGLRDDALTVAQSLSAAKPTIELGVAGTIGRPGSRHVGDRREALQARADGVRRGGSTIVAIGIGLAPADAEQYASILHDVIPDQVWIAVDLTRKPEDTRAWANTLAEAGGGIDAIAAIGSAYTTTPDSTSFLGIPVGWADAAPLSF
jgi:hypothetical protein